MKTGALIVSTTALLALVGCKKAEVPPADPLAVAANDTTMLPEQSAAFPAKPVTTPSFVSQVAISDLYEIEAGKLAAQQAKNPEIKAFAQKMIQDHTATTAQVKQIVSKDKLANPPTELDQDHQSMITDLKAASESDFDALYVDQQRKAHENALNLLQAYAVSGDNGDLKAFASDTAPKVQSHLQMVTELDEKGADETPPG